MTALTFVFDVVRRLAWFLGMPYVAFWALRTLIPSISISYTVNTLGAFWVVFWIVRWMVQNIRHGDWADTFSME